METREDCIFLVDDHIVNLTVGKNALKDKYSVFSLPSGEKLFETLLKIIPTLILLDVNMPDMNGFEVIERLKANPAWADIPVIFLTGKNSAEHELTGLSLGAADYITKPFSPPLLLKRIELHLLLVKQKSELQHFNKQLSAMVKERTQDLQRLQNALMQWTGELVEFRDGTIDRHITNVQQYLTVLIREMIQNGPYAREVGAWDPDALLQSASMHDIGKIRVSDTILFKRGRLTEREMTEIQRHSEYGYQLLEKLQERVPQQNFLNYAKSIALWHHEKWDGSGYPHKLKGEEIPLEARLMAIADVYDALISERPYKPAYSHEAAVDIMRDAAGTHFEPALTDLFLRCESQLQAISKA